MKKGMALPISIIMLGILLIVGSIIVAAQDRYQVTYSDSEVTVVAVEKDYKHSTVCKFSMLTPKYRCMSMQQWQLEKYDELIAELRERLVERKTTIERLYWELLITNGKVWKA